jgi:hypothetical protein
VGKEPPQTVAIRDIITPDISAKVLGEWKEEKIYKANPWYRTAETIQEEIKQRFAVPTTQTRAPKPAPTAQPNNNPQGTPGEQSAEPSPPKDTPKPKRKSVFDDIAGG